MTRGSRLPADRDMISFSTSPSAVPGLSRGRRGWEESMETKVIAVVGATGAQEGGLVRATHPAPVLQTFDAWLEANAARIPVR